LEEFFCNVKVNLRFSAGNMKTFSTGQQWILFVLALVVLAVFYSRFYLPSNPPFPEKTFNEIVIEVTGEVRTPGIYFFQSPPTLKVALGKAGGLKEGGLFDPTSSSEVLETGTLVHAAKESPTQIKTTVGRMESRKLLVFSIPLDLNRVSMEDLCLVPGIGESLAKEIVEYRKKRRAFGAVSELRNVRGIGEKKWQSFRAFFTVN
jgi:competence protein ComEA